jgi:Cof subfamily protein (haloacid dehalogenase superfamily)
LIKGILTDMDGTILNSEGKLSPYTKSVLKEVLDNGIKLAVASGRFFPSIHDIFKEFDEEIIYTCNNGTWIENSSRTKVYHKSIFSIDEVKRIFAISKKLTKSGCFVCTPNEAIADQHYPYIEKEFKVSDARLIVVDDLFSIDEEITKITICVLEDINALSKSFKEELGDDYVVVISGDVWLDIIKKGASKANAFPILHDELGIKAEEMLIFGDYDNDIPMLKMSPNSFAMADASEGAKKAANTIIGKNDDHAVAKKIEEIVLKSIRK